MFINIDAMITIINDPIEIYPSIQNRLCRSFLLWTDTNDKTITMPQTKHKKTQKINGTKTFKSGANLAS